MTDRSHELPRRDFLKTSVLAGAGSVALGTGLANTGRTEDAKPAATASGIPEKAFGKTGRTLPILGMGGSAMVQQWVGAYGVGLLPMEDRVKMVRHAFDSGVRYFDTARVYGESEKIMGEGLKGVRDQVYLATKIAVRSPAQTRPSLEKSLSELGTDYVDCAQVHSPTIEALGFDGAMKVHAELRIRILSGAKCV
jgi:aryl-alcohol dehydrogenase-like predicted oxidoreductase